IRPGGRGSPGMTSSSPVKNNPRRTRRPTGSNAMPTDAASPVSCGRRRSPAGSTSPPARISLPVRRIHSPRAGTFFTTTSSPSCAQCSCITMASAPAGIGAPVKMRAAVPRASGSPVEPAGIFWETLSRGSGPFRSARRTAYPSMALLSMGGTFMVERCAAASTRPVAESIRSDRNDVRVLRIQQGLAVVLAPNLELRQRMMLVAFNKQQIAGRNALDLVLQGGLRLAAQLVHHDPAPVGHDHDLAAAGLAVTVGILARLINVEAVMRVLDHRYPETAPDEARNELLDQGGLAASRPSGEAEDLHARHCIRASFPLGYSGGDCSFRVREEQLLAADLVPGDRLLPLGRDDPVDERLAEILFYVGVLGGIHQHHPVLVEQARVAFDRDGELAPVLERYPGAAVGEDVGAHRRSRVQRRAHALARVAVPRPLLGGDVDSGRFPEIELGDVRAAPIAPRYE